MYLSRLVLNPRSRQVWHDLTDCQSLHRSVLAAFPLATGGNGTRDEFGVLYRLEPSRRGSAPVLLVQSRVAPEWGRLPSDYLAPSTSARNPSTTSLKPFLESIQAGEILRFRLRANPTRKVDTKSRTTGERRNGRRVKLKTEAEQVAWLRRKAAEGSFEVLTVRTAASAAAVDVIDERQLTGWRPAADGPARRLTFGAVLFEGHLRVADPEQFRRAIEHGLGSAKAYGFGLLSVGRDGAV
jgi:CRISPR system Cascade subunit CasE